MNEDNGQEINLGQQMDMPEEAEVSPVLGSDSPDKPDNPTIYPELSIHDHTNPALMKIPDKGHALVKYEVTHRGMNTHARHGGKKKTRHSISMKIHSFKPHKSSKKKGHRLPGAADDEAAVDAGL